MRPWLRRSLTLAGVFGACWLGSVWTWRATRRMPDNGQLLFFLLLLPVLLLVLLWVGRKLLDSGGARALPPAVALPADAALAAPAPDLAPPPAALSVLGGALRMPHGETPAQLAEALLTRRATLALDPELLDESGYPILSGRVGDVDALAQEDAMASWLDAHHPGIGLQGEQWRALALGSAVAADLAAELGPHPSLAPYLDALAAGRALPALPQLHLLTVLPSEWSPAGRQMADGWLREVVARHGWPASRLAPPPAESGLPPLAMVHALAEQAQRDGQPFLCLLLACGSRIGHASVAAWAERFILFDSAHPNGRIPGEGAAGLLLCDHLQGALFEREQAVLIHPAATGDRAAPPDGNASARTDTGLLANLAAQALRAAGIAAGEVGMLVADTDRRASRMSELLGMAAATLPALDMGSQVIAVGGACGDAGAVSAVAALVLAQQQVGAGAGPVLCVSNLDAVQRGAVLLLPDAARVAA